MDLISLVGIVGGVAAILLSAILEGSELAALVHPAAMLLIAGGTIGATIACYSMEEILSITKSTMEAVKRASVEPEVLIATLGELATLGRREGLLVLEHYPLKLDNILLKRGIRLLVDGTAPEVLKDILVTQVATQEAQAKMQASIYQTAGGFAPTMGIIGTVVGLVHVLSNLSEPEMLGHAIAGAFLATLYGIGVANLVFLPLAKKLHYRAHQEAEVGLLIVEGLVSIQSGDNPRFIQEKLMSLIHEEKRGRVLAVQAAAAEVKQ
ncbi:MAG: MotA/TolQ/ExbB proton channel family protein [Candidatus Hydrogenedentes bacterium]|nr:MotA/TolQ/ExbB proton channel family protein [Candidatus Hydrogenedentota bacterium]